MRPNLPTPDRLQPDIDNPTVESGAGDPRLDSGVGAVLVRSGLAQELGSCNRCSWRGKVFEVELGSGRLTFRLCNYCALDVAYALEQRVHRGSK